MTVQVFVQSFHFFTYYEFWRLAFSEKIGILFLERVQNEVVYDCYTKKNSSKLLFQTQLVCVL